MEITDKYLSNKRVIVNVRGSERKIRNMFIARKLYPLHNLIAIPFNNYCGLCISENLESTVFAGTWKLYGNRKTV